MDITLDLTKDKYRPFVKPNNTIKYVSKLSNHPPVVTKNLPCNININIKLKSVLKIKGLTKKNLWTPSAT